MIPKIIVIAGQTASGKNELAIKLAKDFNGIIINADSRQIYRDLNVATAKPIPEKIKKDGTWYISNIPHYLYGFASLETQYNIFKYQKDVSRLIKQNKDKVIFLVGGTGLYIDSVVMQYNLPKNTDTNYTELTNEELIEIIGKRYLELNESDKKNRRRLESIAKQINQPNKSRNLKHLYLILKVEKDILKERITDRINVMFKNGLLEENQKIWNKYKNYSLPSLQTIGYQEFEDYFNGQIDLDTLKNLIITHTNQYAKRQLTWFKRNKEAKFISDYKIAYLEVSNFLKTFV